MIISASAVSFLHMMTSSNGNIFHITGPFWGESTSHQWIPLTKAVMRSFDVFFDLQLKKQLSTQARRWWFETPSRSLWPHCYGNTKDRHSMTHGVCEIWGLCHEFKIWYMFYVDCFIQYSCVWVLHVKLWHQGAVSIRKKVLPGMAIPMLKIRCPNGRLIFNMGIPIPGKDGLYIETGPRLWF